MILSAKEISKKSVAIVKFGPAGFPTDGLKPGEYFQVTIDPAMTAGEFIRFGQSPGDEITGWQRIEALSVMHILGEWLNNEPPEMCIGSPSVTMMLAGAA